MNEIRLTWLGPNLFKNVSCYMKNAIIDCHMIEYVQENFVYQIIVFLLFTSDENK